MTFTGHLKRIFVRRFDGSVCVFVPLFCVLLEDNPPVKITDFQLPVSKIWSYNGSITEVLGIRYM